MSEAIADGPGVDLSSPRIVHVVGVAGVGMSAIALLLARMGHVVSGSDIKDSTVFDRLRAAGITVSIGNRAANVPVAADAVVYSTAVPLDNPELVAARELQKDGHDVRVMHRAGALAAIAAMHRTIAVAGSHGKTTTSSMLALILRAAGWQPSFLIGGELNEVGTNAAYGDGGWLVLEADESDGTFLRIVPDAAIVTSVEPDHLDHYGGGFASLVDAFERFVDSVAGPVVIGVDDAESARIARARAHVRTYGEDARADYRVTHYRSDASGCRFTLVADGATLGDLVVPIGVKAATNATGAAAMALELGVPFAEIARALRSFGGVARRFQFRGERDGVAFVDDYAHLPTEVAASITTAREAFAGRVIVVFQPHRYSRTASLGRDFADAFTGADIVVITDVYAAGERPIAGVNGRLVADAVSERHPDLDLAYVAGRRDLDDLPVRLARPGDVVLTLGAGDLTTMPDLWLAAGHMS